MDLDPLDVIFKDYLDEVDDVMDEVAGFMSQYSENVSGRVSERA